MDRRPSSFSFIVDTLKRKWRGRKSVRRGERACWLRLLIESVDVPLDFKEPHRLLFSTVQSLIPGAHGLYYRDPDGSRKALAFDGTGYVKAPETGWDQQDIFVHLASVANHRRKSSKTSSSQDSTEEEIVNKRYKEENEEMQRKVAELEEELSTAREALEEVTAHESHDKQMLREAAACAEARLDEAESMAEAATRRLCDMDREHKKDRERADKAEWSLGEHRAWLAESKSQVSTLEGQLAASREQLDEQRARADAAEWTLGEHVAWLEQARIRNGELENTVSELHDQVTELRDRAEISEWNLEEQKARLAEEKEKTKAITDAADSATTELRERLVSIESELCNHRAAPVITPPEHNLTPSTHSEEDREEEKEIEEEITLVTVSEQQAVPQKEDTVVLLESRIRDLERELLASRHAVEAEFEARLAAASQRADASVAEIVAAKKRIQELTEKEDELNNLHTVIEDLRDKLKEMERSRSDAEWHLGEHRDWLKNEKDKVIYLEEQLRRVNAGETISRSASRKNSSESGFGGGSVHLNGEDSGGERRGSESPPAAPRKMKITSAPDDLAAELMTLSKDKQRMALEIRELKSRPDPLLIEAERRAVAEQVAAVHERCSRLEAETAHYKDVASRVNLDEFSAKDGKISELEKARANLEWTLGERNQEVHDLKWRIGELEGALAQQRSASPANTEQIDRQLRELQDHRANLQQQLSDLQWRLGEKEAELGRLRADGSGDQQEVTALRQLTSDQKWRIGELESGYAHHEWLLSQRPTHEEVQQLRGENSSLEHQLAEAWRAANDAKWRVGELEAALASQQQRCDDAADLKVLREDKARLEKAWHDQKWRIGELEAGYAHHEHVIAELRNLKRIEDASSVHEHELEWKLGEAHQELQALRDRISHLESELVRRDAAAAAERPGQLEESFRNLRSERDQLERRVQELDKAYNDTKWRNGELEAGLAHTKWLLHEERNKLARFADDCSDASRDGSFIVRYRRPDDAQLWQLAAKTSRDDTAELRAVTLTIDDESDTDAAFVIGSFSAWECCARLTRPSTASSKRTVTLHLPRGRHEFRFIVEGGWSNSASYPTLPNPFGTTNNWISVE